MIDVKQGGFTTYPLEFVALGLLMSGPKHGYALYRDFTQAFNLIWHSEQARFYGVLAALEEKGYLRTTTKLQKKLPVRKVYHITDSGQSVFMSWVRQPVRSMRAVRVEFIAKLRFYSLLRLPGAEQFIDDQMAALHAILKEWEEFSNGQEQQGADLIQVWLKDFRKRQAMFMIEWLAVCKESANDLFVVEDAHSS